MQPRTLNLSCPADEDTYELHMKVKSKIGVLHEITGFLAREKVDILSMHIQASKGRTAEIVAFLHMEESETSVEKLLEAVRKLEFVQEADAAKKDKVIFEEFLFPIMMDEEVRGFLMTEGVWSS